MVSAGCSSLQPGDGAVGSGTDLRWLGARSIWALPCGTRTRGGRRRSAGEVYDCGQTGSGRVVLQRDRPIRAGEQLAHDGQSETGASCVPVPGVVKAGEPLEHLLPLTSRYPRSVVDDAQHWVAAFGARREGDRRAGVTHRVVDQVG